MERHHWRDARVAEEARLESVWPPKGAREFESRSLRKFLTALQIVPQGRFCIIVSGHLNEKGTRGLRIPIPINK